MVNEHRLPEIFIVKYQSNKRLWHLQKGEKNSLEFDSSTFRSQKLVEGEGEEVTQKSNYFKPGILSCLEWLLRGNKDFFQMSSTETYFLLVSLKDALQRSARPRTKITETGHTWEARREGTGYAQAEYIASAPKQTVTPGGLLCHQEDWPRSSCASPHWSS